MAFPADIPAEIREQADILADQYRDIKDDREFLARCLMADRAGRHVGLTVMQRKLVDFISNFVAEHGHSPSYGEICKAIGKSSKGSLHDMVQRLVHRGVLATAPNCARAIVVLPVGEVSSVHKISEEA